MSELERPGPKLRIAVLMGGTSSERPVSLVTGQKIVEALDPARYEAVAIDTADLLCLTGVAPMALPTPQAASDTGGEETTIDSASDPPRVANAPATLSGRPDLLFIALHGRGGEDGTVQGMLEFLGIPYTGSGVLASALAMDKTMTKRLFGAAGIPVIDGIAVGQDALAATETFEREVGRPVADRLGYPVFVKPNAEGSTFGCTLVESPAALQAAVRHALTYDRTALIETYVRGTEITVGVLGNAGENLQALPVVEIVPKATYYDYESKYAEGGSEHIIPARLSEERLLQAQEIARRCHTLLGCRGMSRTDMIATDTRLFVLEVNTIPGMTPTSLLPQAAAHAGIAFPELLDRLIESALRK